MKILEKKLVLAVNKKIKTKNSWKESVSVETGRLESQYYSVVGGFSTGHQFLNKQAEA